MKKLFPDNKVTKKSLLEFLDKRGFYIVLILCIAIVAATAVFVTYTGNNARDELNSENLIPEDLGANAPNANQPEGTIGEAALMPDTNAAVTDTGTAGDPKALEASAQTAQASVTDDKKPQEKQPAKKPSAPKKTSAPKGANPEEAKFIAPVFGQVTFEFANDKLIYSKTLEEWRTHEGIDIAADRGTTVKSVADGVVNDIKNDPGFGVTVIIDHKNGLKTVYSNLASDEMVTPNQIVKQGDIIGCVGNTAMFESAEESHLHFEVLKSDVGTDPAAYLPKK